MVQPISEDEIVYTAISFAPVQGFIEKSRKLRDLYGASQILSYLSAKIVSRVQEMDIEGVKVISPSLCADKSDIDLIQGMPNRILLEGKFSYNDAKNALTEGWNEIIFACRSWIEEHPQLSNDFTFSGDGWGRAWTKWKINAWEIFWGEGIGIKQAMLSLETNKLRRDWTVPNWNGESSTLSGSDAIAYPDMDSKDNVGHKYNVGREREEIRAFYKKLAKALENTKQQDDPIFLDPTEWLSIPELIKRLVTHHQVARLIDKKSSLYTKSFRELIRVQEDGGYWTGWFMGDGDGVGKHLKENLTTSKDIQDFSHILRTWGREFQAYFNANLGRVVYAGGDDFLGVMFGTENKLHQNGTEKLKQKNGTEVLKFLIDLHNRWDSGKLGINLSVGFVWAGHSVPQRDILQHCREAEKVAKNLGKNRVTIRILFNNGQYVEWTTPWQYLEWLNDYRDRSSPERKMGKDANWSHVYSDFAQLKARHAIPPKTVRQNNPNEDVVALSLLGLYFGEEKKAILSEQRKTITGLESRESVIRWIEGMIQVGWQLCSNFKFLITVRPLGLLYGSAGAFLSPENLVGRSGSKFPPDAATLSGLFLSTNREKPFVDDHQELKLNLTIAGAFWAKDEDFQHGNQDFYVPIPRSLIIDEDKIDQWEIREGKWYRPKNDEDINSAYSWQTISSWGKSVDFIQKQGISDTPWKFVPMLHPTLEPNQRHVRTSIGEDDRGSLFLENAVQMQEGSFLVYLSTHQIPDGWYRFGGENHLVEISSQPLDSDILDLFNEPIERKFALICPAVWGTNNLSFRYPKDVGFSNKRPEMLTDRPIPVRHRLVKGNDKNQRTNALSIGRYAVPAGTVYIVKHPLNMTWWDFPSKWFPQSNEKFPVDQRPLPLKHLGCGLCLPIQIKEK